MTTLYRTMSLLAGVAALTLAGCDSNTSGSGSGAANAQSTPDETEAAEAQTVSSARTLDSRLAPSLSDQASAEAVSNRARERVIEAKDSAPGEAAVFYVKTQPEILDFGEVGANQKPSATVLIVNEGTESYKILACKTNCGCTTANCPRDTVLAPGDSAEVEVSVSTGSTAHKIQKFVTFDIEGHAPVRLPVMAEVISYVSVEPDPIDRRTNPGGRIVLRATDDQPFRLMSVDPPVVEVLPDHSTTVHEVEISWELWEQMGAGYRRITFETDHPKATKVQSFVRGTSPVAAERERMKDMGVVQPPVTALTPLDELNLAIRSGDMDKFKTALEAVPEQAGRNEALVVAARTGNIQAVELLLEGGADINARDSRQQPPLVTAVRSGKADVVQALLDLGADPNVTDRIDATALCWAAGPFGDASMVDVLLKAGSDVNAADKNGMTPVMWAVRFGDAARVKSLLEAGADPSIKDPGGKTALDYAKDRNDADAKLIVDLLSN